MIIARKNMLSLIVRLSLLFLMVGCEMPKGPIEVILPPRQRDMQQEPGTAAAVGRFQNSAAQAPSAVDSAIELSEKYAQLSEKAAALKLQNHDIINENKILKEKITEYQLQLKQTSSELTQANDLLIEMRLELNNWKTDILGFRNEMRDADQAQLQALLKIFNLLGGEVVENTEQIPDPNAAVADLGKSK